MLGYFFGRHDFREPEALLPALLALASIAAVITMISAWAYAQRIRNASIVDVVWAGLFAVLAVLYASLGDGWQPRRMAILALAGLWSLRLFVHLYARVARLHPKVEPRYVELRRRWRGRFFGFFQLQGLSTILLSIPLLLACLDGEREFRPLEVAGAALVLLAVAGESIADEQLRRFKADPANKGPVCRTGLWAYSRHPNYFFEWLVWCGFFLVAAQAPWGWVTIYCPLVMLLLLFRLTGIPLQEQLAVKRKGEAYREYQRTTSAFVPWFSRAAKPRFTLVE